MLKKRFISFIMAASVAVASWGIPVSTGWETAPRHEVRDAKSVIKDNELEIMTLPSCIVVSTGHKIHIQVFTILGRLVSAETLQPGVSKLTVGAHGIYIIKAGELTCKVAI